MLWLSGALLLAAFTLLFFGPEDGRDYPHWRK